VVADQHARRGPHTELTFGHLEDPLVRLGDAVVLGEHHGLEVPPQSHLLGEPAAVGEQAQPVLRRQRVQTGERVGEEGGVAVAVVEVRGAQLGGQRGVRRLVTALDGAPPLQRAGEAEDAQPGQVELHALPLQRDGGAVVLEVLPAQRCGERSRPRRSHLGHDRHQGLAHDALEVPQRLVPVEEDGLYHRLIR